MCIMHILAINLKNDNVSFLHSSDKPSPPRELQVTEVTADSVGLKWDIPEDDGGSPIVHYIVEKKDISRKSWQEVCKCEGLEAVADKLHEGSQYLFRVCAENQYGVSEPVELAEPVTAKYPFSKCSHHQ